MKLPGRDLVAEGAAHLRDAERQLAPHAGRDVVELDEHRLRRLRPQVGDRCRVLDRADVGREHEVELARSVSVPSVPQFGQAISDGGPLRSSSRKRSLQLRQSTIGSLKPATCPDASHTRGFMMIAASMPTTSSRSVTMCRHQAALTLFFSSTPSGP